MPGEWEVLAYKSINGKRFVKIRDIPNDRVYEQWFKGSVSKTAIKNRFKEQVNVHRAELSRTVDTIDLTNFEASL